MPNPERDTTRAAGRPRVICHMLTSVDGRIVTEGWPLSPEGRRQYEEVHSMYDAYPRCDRCYATCRRR